MSFLGMLFYVGSNQRYALLNNSTLPTICHFFMILTFFFFVKTCMFLTIFKTCHRRAFKIQLHLAQHDSQGSSLTASRTVSFFFLDTHSSTPQQLADFSYIEAGLKLYFKADAATQICTNND